MFIYATVRLMDKIVNNSIGKSVKLTAQPA